MSIQSLCWALDQEIFPSSHKFVLVALANFMGDTGKCYPGVQTISDLTSQKDETVRNALAALVDSGIIKDTGKRVGETNQIKVYQLPNEAWERPPKKGILNKSQEDPGKTPERPPKTAYLLILRIRDPGSSTLYRREKERLNHHFHGKILTL